MRTGLERISIIGLAVIVTALWLLLQAVVKDRPAPEITPEENPDLPKSVLHYSAYDGSIPATIPCYTKNNYETLLNSLNQEKGLIRAGQATLEDGSRLEIYRSRADESFIAFSVGTDKSGAPEICRIASGKNIQWSEETFTPFIIEPDPVHSEETAPAQADEMSPAADLTAQP